MTSPRLAVAAAVLFFSVSLFAAPAAKYQEWGKGPVQWLMTRDEQRAWSQVQDDKAASEFIDLFWARRDPTPGTEFNQFKEEFEGRVRSADKAFAHGKKRGSMTDMGRAFVILGPPKESNLAKGAEMGLTQGGASDPDSIMGSDTPGGDSVGGKVVTRTTGKTQFTYDNYVAVGLVRPTITFIEDGYSHEYKLDPQQGNPFGALAAMSQKALVNPELTAVPPWALKGGLEAGRKNVVVTKFIPGKGVIPAPATPIVTGDPGPSRLMLLKNVTVEVKPMSGGDPLGALSSNSTFSRSEELGYAFQLCRNAASDDNVKVTMKVTGTAGNHQVNMSAPPEDMTPEQIKASSACYVVRAALPLADFEAGDYHLELTVDDGGKSYNMGQDFKVQ
ncbi:MAG TPA: GWxTD domain-containing protein [Thermoanaerobaculia bacterium]|nr:GWxTD domain-containing protein [Thermoanaerobaculia bacterium]